MHFKYVYMLKENVPQKDDYKKEEKQIKHWNLLKNFMSVKMIFYNFTRCVWKF